ncbi:hypothetical protein GQ600_8156 [Phytophthora cactorum]|nr:hypothetical protein GQ600_8156 [Phytophthora cactorum]
MPSAPLTRQLSSRSSSIDTFSYRRSSSSHSTYAVFICAAMSLLENSSTLRTSCSRHIAGADDAADEVLLPLSTDEACDDLR